MEYYDRTLFEITAELDGYGLRLEERYLLIRPTHTLLYNVNAKPGKTKKDYELMPLPGDYEEIDMRAKMQKLKMQVASERGIKTI